MDSNDVKKLWALLAELYPRQPQEGTKARLAAWALALEPYDYDAIRDAALAHARKNAYYPSISEITSELPPPDDEAWMDEYIDAGHKWAKIAEKQEAEIGERFSVSKYAREHDLTWEQAAVEAHNLGLIDSVMRSCAGT